MQSQKLSFSIFAGLKELIVILKNEDHSKPSILVNQITFQVISTKAECLFGFSVEIKLFCSLYPAGSVTVPTYLQAAKFQKR